MSKFKVGDWVRYAKADEETAVGQVLSIDDNFMNIGIIDDTIYYRFDLEYPINAALWCPEIDDWCWYGFELVQVLDVQPNHIKICRQKSPTYEEIPQEKLKPFIGQLPEIVYEDIRYDDDK